MPRANGLPPNGRSARSATLCPPPHGIGADYARRYALFALVGIVGEDDIDAADLNLVAGQGTNAAIEVATATPTAPSVAPTLGRRNSKPPSPARITRDPASSAAIREQLLAECAGLLSQDDAVAWASRTLKAKNTLCPADAQLVEQAFQQRMEALGYERDQGIECATANGDGERSRVDEDPSMVPDSTSALSESVPIKKSAIAIALPRRHRNKAHLRFVASKPCLVCGRLPCDPHHLRFAQTRGLGLKVSDEFTVPLCRTHHRALHRSGAETAWWAQFKLDPLKVAHRLWRQTRNKRNRASSKIQIDGTEHPANDPLVSSTR